MYTKSQHLELGSVLCEAALSPETQTKLGEGAEDFCVRFGDTECACAQIHTVHTLASMWLAADCSHSCEEKLNHFFF